MRTARQKNAEKISLSFLFKLTSRTVLFLFLFLTVLLFFYTVGNFQLFLDSNQKIILNAAAFTATTLLVFSLTGFIISIFCIIRKKGKRLFYTLKMILIAFSTAYALVFLILLRATAILSSGI